MITTPSWRVGRPEEALANAGRESYHHFWKHPFRQPLSWLPFFRQTPFWQKSGLEDILLNGFEGLGLRSLLLGNLDSLGFANMTPIQSATLPAIIAGRDVIGRARTGSGKTVAFGLGLLNKLAVEQFRVQALVLCPTRELADQVGDELRRLARTIHNIKILTLCGGAPMGPQIHSLSHGAHIIVGTPGRVADHLRKGRLDVSHLVTLVLDEADRMLDMGFEPSLREITDYLPADRQNLLFSATWDSPVQSLVDDLLNDPASIAVDVDHDSDSIAQRLYRIDGEAGRIHALVRLLGDARPTSALVFCNTRQQTETVAGELKRAGFVAAALHGELEQRDRDARLLAFNNQSLSILVATDVAARGLDIELLDAVINYEIAHEPEVHTHRIGRTGRAGRAGLAMTLYQESERFRVDRIASATGQSLPEMELPPQRTAPAYRPPMVTLQIDGGKRDKLRPGDLLGALTKDGGLDGDAVGKIRITPTTTYVAIRRASAEDALRAVEHGKVKGRSFRVRQMKV